MLKTLQQHYYNLHQIPELNDHLPKTQAYILKHLPQCEITIIEKGGILAYFNNHQKETIAFRAEMDALPIQETNDISYISKHPNTMHACAHDAHMAILLTLANHLPNNCTNNVLFIFEYAEETYGGAKQIINHPKYNPTSIYTIHIWPNLPKHQLLTNNHLMATSCEVKIIIHGEGGHIATKEQYIDTNRIACELYNQATLQFPDFFIRFGIIKGGNAPNIIPNQTLLHGTIRSLTPQNIDFAKQYLWKLATLYMMRYSNIIEITFNEGYPAIRNSQHIIDQTKNIIPELQIKPVSYFTTDSFAYYLQNTPGLYTLLGTGDTTPLHASNFIVPLEILETGYQFYYRILMAVADQ